VPAPATARCGRALPGAAPQLRAPHRKLRTVPREARAPKGVPAAHTARRKRRGESGAEQAARSKRRGESGAEKAARRKRAPAVVATAGPHMTACAGAVSPQRTASAVHVRPVYRARPSRRHLRQRSVGRPAQVEQGGRLRWSRPAPAGRVRGWRRRHRLPQAAAHERRAAAAHRSSEGGRARGTGSSGAGRGAQLRTWAVQTKLETRTFMSHSSATCPLRISRSPVARSRRASAPRHLPWRQPLRLMVPRYRPSSAPTPAHQRLSNASIKLPCQQHTLIHKHSFFAPALVYFAAVRFTSGGFSARRPQGTETRHSARRPQGTETRVRED
jgi:hypothetical protein